MQGVDIDVAHSLTPQEHHAHRLDADSLRQQIDQDPLAKSRRGLEQVPGLLHVLSLAGIPQQFDEGSLPRGDAHPWGAGRRSEDA